MVEGVLHRAAQVGRVRVVPLGALSKNQQGQELAEIGDMIMAGAAAITDDGGGVGISASLMRLALEYTDMFDRVVITHAEDASMVHDGYMHEGAVSARLGMRGRPSVAEDIIAARDIMLAEYTGAALHIAHVSSKETVELIRQAKARGVRVTGKRHRTISV